MTGSEEILKKIKSGATGVMFLGLTLTLLPTIIIICMIISGSFAGNVLLVVILILCTLVGAVVMAYNMKIMLNPMSSLFIKKNPDILSEADELTSNIVYRDSFLLFSNRLIANAHDIRQISYTDEVFVVYVYIHKTNGVVDMKQLKLETARRTISINIYSKKDDEIDQLIGNILQNCRYARVGYNDDSMAYLKKMRDIWKQDQERRKGS